MMNIQWINSAGGPLVCLSPTAARAWQGTTGSSVDDARSDYARACDQLDYVSAIACGNSQALVLGDEPLRSGFAVNNETVLVVRWVSCISSELADSVISGLPPVLPSIEAPTRFCINDGDLIMFDAALSSVDPTVCASVHLKAGAFMVTTERFKSEGAYEFLIHRLLRAKDH